MNALVAAGGIGVPGENVQGLEAALNEVCAKSGFPPGEEFKWSPGGDQWMRRALVLDERRDFQLRILDVAKSFSVVVNVVISDMRAKTATKAATPEDDVTWMLLERANRLFGRNSSPGIVVVDLPAGGRSDETKFLSRCAETIQEGTDFSTLEHLALNVITSSSRTIRLLQLADLMASCTLARVSGESHFSPPIFERIRELLDRDDSRIGGVGLKLHPDFKYVNLYHWLVGDSRFHKMWVRLELPIENRPYRLDEQTYWT